MKKGYHKFNYSKELVDETTKEKNSFYYSKYIVKSL